MRASSETPGGTKGALREPVWVESNVQKEAARALEMLHVQLISSVIDPYSWKWVMMALHHALQAFVVASLSDAEGPKIREPRSSTAGFKVWHGFDELYSQPKPDYLPELYDRVKQEIGFQPGREVDEDVERLVRYRDVFVQCLPLGWALRVEELPRTARNCLRIVEHLGWSPGRIGWQKEDLADLARVKYLASMKVLEALHSQYRA